ncbi:MAG: sodium:solute symporter [Planctomycetaceae bacterium]|nr:sodium:solute symporter [Planctomycetaceae bacterium]
MNNTLGFVDWATLTAYFAVLLGIAWWVIRQQNKSSKDYFLAGRHAGWLIIGSSLFASNIGSEHLVGLAGTAASNGMAMAHFELHAWILLVLGWVFVPFYMRSGVYTMPEFLERRYSPAARWFLSVVSLIAYVFTKISVALFAGGIVFKALFPVPLVPWMDNFWLGAVVMVVVTGLYTILGGLRAVLYTELMQTGVLLLGTACVLFIGLYQVGGWNSLKETVQGTDKIVAYRIVNGSDIFLGGEPDGSMFLKDKDGKDIYIKRPKTINSDKLYTVTESLTEEEIKKENLQERCTPEVFASVQTYSVNSDDYYQAYRGLVPANPPEERRVKTDHFNLWKPNSDPQFPWFGLLFGAPIVGFWYWCTDQYIVQRTLAAKNQREARRGTIFGAYLKLTPIFLFIVPGMIAYALAVQGKLGPEVLHDPNQAFPILVKEVLPIGLKGIVIGALLAALMSSLASVFNSCSALFTMDIYTKIHPTASETQLVWVGRIATAVMVFLGLAWIPVIQFIPGTLYEYLQSVQSYIAPPIAMVFFIGIFSKRVNAYGCMTGLIVGFILGMLRLGLEILNITGCWPAFFVQGGIVHQFATTSFTFIAIYLAAISSFFIVVVSLLTPKPREEQIVGLTYGTSTEEQRKETHESWTALDVVLTFGLVAIIIAIYAYFTG